MGLLSSRNLLNPLSLPPTSRTAHAIPPSQLFMAIVAFNTLVDWCEQTGSNLYTLVAAAAVVGSLIALARVLGLLWNRVHARRRSLDRDGVGGPSRPRYGDGEGLGTPQAEGDGPPSFVNN